jgi:NAD(P)-dependent dehydrogenase (short-subunit alcohol dehydrogenase family)
LDAQACGNFLSSDDSNFLLWFTLLVTALPLHLQQFALNLYDYKSGLRFVQKVKDEVPRLNILLCNGGVNHFKYKTSESGHEWIIQINCYARFLVFFSLLPQLQATAAEQGSPSRVTFLSLYTRLPFTGKNPISSG